MISRLFIGFGVVLFFFFVFFFTHPKERTCWVKNISLFLITFLIGAILLFQESLGKILIEKGLISNILAKDEIEQFARRKLEAKPLYSWYGGKNFQPALFVVLQKEGKQKKIAFNAQSGKILELEGLSALPLDFSTFKKQEEEKALEVMRYKKLRQKIEEEQRIAAQKKVAALAAKKQLEVARQKIEEEQRAVTMQKKERQEKAQAALLQKKLEQDRNKIADIKRAEELARQNELKKEQVKKEAEKLLEQQRLLDQQRKRAEQKKLLDLQYAKLEQERAAKILAVKKAKEKALKASKRSVQSRSRAS